MANSGTSQKGSSQNREVRDGLTALVLLVIVIIASIWVRHTLQQTGPTVWIVLIAASITAVTTGFGALPFLFVDKINDQWLGGGNALASGLMFGASIGLVIEGVTLESVGDPLFRLIVGIILGAVLVILSQRFLEDREEDFSIGDVKGANAVQMLLIVGIMTVHSFAEGIGIGVSYAGRESFGLLVSIAIAIHNIPEGLAISLVLIPRGTRVSRAAFFSIFSSIPQPLMAVPAFLFVLAFRPLLPVGLGLAAGAMFYMVFKELLPEALENIPAKAAYPLMVFAAGAMLLFQFLIE